MHNIALKGTHLLAPMANMTFLMLQVDAYVLTDWTGTPDDPSLGIKSAPLIAKDRNIMIWIRDML
jgi:hypothetical protein